MSRQAQQDAQSTYDQQQSQSQLYGANANAAYSNLMPQYTNMALNPQGFSPTEKANFNTANMQSTGGSTAGAVEAGNLDAARTRNAGGYQGTLSQSARAGLQQNGDNALKVQNADALLKESQRGEGLAGMNGLYGSNLSAETGQTNAENQSTQALTAAGQSGWLQNLTGIMGAVGGAAKGLGSMGVGFGQGQTFGSGGGTD